MSDPRVTGEHFFGAMLDGYLDEPDNDTGPDLDAISPLVAGRRIADLITQAAFLEGEVTRYRQLTETERIRHSTELANLQLQSDNRVDDLRRNERHENQSLHDSYRALLTERQLAHEEQLSTAAAANAAQLAEARAHHEEMVALERARRDKQLEAARSQSVEEATAAQQQELRRLESELAQAKATIVRLEADIDRTATTTSDAMLETHQSELAIVNMQRRLDATSERHQREIAQLDTGRAAAIERLDTERQRAAATLAELLERSAALAAEADAARSGYAAEQAKTEHAAALARQQADADYVALANAADERASRALLREAELEAVIADLRQDFQA